MSIITFSFYIFQSVKEINNNNKQKNIQNKYGDTPLHVAAKSGQIKAATLLVEKGANVDIKNNEGRYCYEVVDTKVQVQLSSILYSFSLFQLDFGINEEESTKISSELCYSNDYRRLTKENFFEPINSIQLMNNFRLYNDPIMKNFLEDIIQTTSYTSLLSLLNDDYYQELKNGTIIIENNRKTNHWDCYQFCLALRILSFASPPIRSLCMPFFI